MDGRQLNSHMFPAVYQWLGINIDKLGCVMADIQQDDALDMRQYPIDQLSLYFAKDPSKFWINGWCANLNPHVTLLFGLLQPAVNFAPHIAEVMKGWEMPTVTIKDVSFFESPYEDEPYYCIVAHLDVSPVLLEGHQRLEFLPHINTFAGYKPHISLCYIKQDQGLRDNIVAMLKQKLVGYTLAVSPALNLGGDK